MCIIVDTNCLASVFDKSSAKHSDFEPVLNWILSGKGKLIYGGTKYLTELGKSRKYLKIIGLLNSRAKRVIIVDKEKVDQEQVRIESLITDNDFDDPHLPAIVIISKCMLICSEDSRSTKFVTRGELYPKGIIVPKYYMGFRNKDLLCNENIDKKYKPFTKCNKKEKDIIIACLKFK
jgi:hypothetical protein